MIIIIKQFQKIIKLRNKIKMDNSSNNEKHINKSSSNEDQKSDS